MSGSEIVLDRMDILIDKWGEAADRRALFLNCYMLMTRNILLALEAGDFKDAIWVSALLERFAKYYFDALEDYDRSSQTTPAVWRFTHDAARNPEVMVLQNVLLGINAHINYDLVLALVDLLEPEKSRFTAAQQELRYQDHYHVNHIIARTIDSVQDEVIEPQAPALDLVDKLFGPLDEWYISHLITHWRDEVWKQALLLLETASPDQREILRQKVEDSTIKRADLILLKDKGELIHSLLSF